MLVKRNQEVLSDQTLNFLAIPGDTLLRYPATRAFIRLLSSSAIIGSCRKTLDQTLSEMQKKCLELGEFSPFTFWLSEYFSFLHFLSVSTKLLFPCSRLLTRRHADINMRRNNEPEAFPDRGEVQGVHVVDLLQ